MFWALVASSFLGESAQSDPARPHSSPGPPRRGAARPLGPGLSSRRESPRSHGEKPKDSAHQPGGRELQPEQLVGELCEEPDKQAD